MTEISRQEYARLASPTTGDKIRLADTGLYIDPRDAGEHAARRASQQRVQQRRLTDPGLAADDQCATALGYPIEQSRKNLKLGRAADQTRRPRHRG